MHMDYIKCVRVGDLDLNAEGDTYYQQALRRQADIMMAICKDKATGAMDVTQVGADAEHLITHFSEDGLQYEPAVRAVAGTWFEVRAAVKIRQGDLSGFVSNTFEAYYTHLGQHQRRGEEDSRLGVIKHDLLSALKSAGTDNSRIIANMIQDAYNQMRHLIDASVPSGNREETQVMPLKKIVQREIVRDRKKHLLTLNNILNCTIVKESLVTSYQNHCMWYNGQGVFGQSLPEATAAAPASQMFFVRFLIQEPGCAQVHFKKKWLYRWCRTAEAEARGKYMFSSTVCKCRTVIKTLLSAIESLTQTGAASQMEQET